MSVFRRINAQFDIGPWWAKILLAVFYAVGFAALWFGARWIADGFDPVNRGAARWIGATFGDAGVGAATVMLFVGIGALIWWSKRR